MEKESKPKVIKKKFSFAEIIITAIITAILTSASSYFLTKNQLSQEQKYWEHRKIKERNIEMLDRQTLLFEEINSGILEMEVLSKDIKLSSVELIINLRFHKIGDAEAKIQGQSFYQKAFEYHKRLNNFASKVQMVPFYFSEKVTSLIAPLSESLEKNYKNNLRIGETLDLENIEEYLNQDFETIKELTEIRLKLIKAMTDEISSTSQKIFVDTN